MPMNTPHPATDPILDELHAVRRQILDEYGGDIDKLVADLRERQDTSGRVAVPAPTRSFSVGPGSRPHQCP